MRGRNTFKSPVATCIAFLDIFFIVLVEWRSSFTLFFVNHSLTFINELLNAARRPVDLIVFWISFFAAGLIDQMYRKNRGLQKESDVALVIRHVFYLFMLICFYFYPAYAGVWIVLAILGSFIISVIDWTSLYYLKKKTI